MPDSVRVLHSSFSQTPIGGIGFNDAVEQHPCEFDWGDSLKMMRGSLLAMGFGAGMWVAVFWVLSLLRQ